MRKKFAIHIKFLVGIMIIFLGSDIWAQTSFRCKASFHGQVIQLAYASPDETYMASGSIGGFDIDAYDNETASYSLQVTQSEELVSSATLPYYEDANLQVGRQSDPLIVQCVK